MSNKIAELLNEADDLFNQFWTPNNGQLRTEWDKDVDDWRLRKDKALATMQEQETLNDPNFRPVICPTCDGTGDGDGCYEHGWFIAGVCRECHGYGKWWRLKTPPKEESPAAHDEGAGSGREAQVREEGKV